MTPIVESTSCVAWCVSLGSNLTSDTSCVTLNTFNLLKAQFPNLYSRWLDNSLHQRLLRELNWDMHAKSLASPVEPSTSLHWTRSIFIFIISTPWHAIHMLPLFFKDFLICLLFMSFIFVKGLTMSPRLISNSRTWASLLPQPPEGLGLLSIHYFSGFAVIL